MKKLTTIILGFGALLPVLTLQAQTDALQSFSGGIPLAGPGATAGREFQANSAITVTALGFYQSGMSSASVPVGLWDAGGTLLGQVAVTPGSTLDNGFLYSPLSSGVSLTAGQDYFVGALLGDNDTVLGFASSVVTAPQVTYLNDAYIYAGVLSAPLSTAPGQEAGYFGANFQFNAAPDGGATMMLLGMGLAALGFVRRKIS